MVDDKILPVSNDNMNIMRTSIKDFWYLEERGWFMRNQDLQNKLLNLINFGMSNRVFVFAGDFELHLDYLLSAYYESKNEGENYNHLYNEEKYKEDDDDDEKKDY